jgi:hypothetical protein
VVTLNLTINESTSSIDIQEHCDAYTWNGNVIAESGTHVDTLQTASGCDSVVSLNLLINKKSDDCDICVAGKYESGDTNNDGVCNVDEVEGCMSDWADNYDELANTDDDSCFRTCTDSDACDFNMKYRAPGNCIYKSIYYYDEDRDGFADGNQRMDLCPDKANNGDYIGRERHIIQPNDPCPTERFFTGIHNRNLYNCTGGFVKNVVFSNDQIEHGMVDNDSFFKTVFAYNAQDRFIFDETDAKYTLRNYDGGTVSNVHMRNDYSRKKWLPPTEDQLKVIHKAEDLFNGIYWMLDDENKYVLNQVNFSDSTFFTLINDDSSRMGMLIYTFEIEPTFF